MIPLHRMLMILVTLRYPLQQRYEWNESIGGTGLQQNNTYVFWNIELLLLRTSKLLVLTDVL